MRNIYLVEFWLSLVVLTLSLVTLLVGVRGNHAGAPIATFNTSSLGLAAYHDPASPLHSAVLSVIPSGVVSPPSITRYLNAKDWYSMHYFSVCSGYYVPSNSNSALLTSTKTNVTCLRQWSGYSFSLQNTVASTLFDEVKELAEEMTAQGWKTGNASSAWYTGISNLFLCLVALAFTIGGKSKVRPWWRETIVMSFISWLCFIIGSGILTHQIIAIHHLNEVGIGPNPYPGTFLALTWCCSVFELMAFCLRWWEIRTEKRQCVSGACGERKVEPAAQRDMERGKDSKEWEVESRSC